MDFSENFLEFFQDNYTSQNQYFFWNFLIPHVLFMFHHCH